VAGDSVASLVTTCDVVIAASVVVVAIVAMVLPTTGGSVGLVVTGLVVTGLAVGTSVTPSQNAAWGGSFPPPTVAHPTPSPSSNGSTSQLSKL